MIAIVTWEPGVPNFERYIFSLDGIFFWQRVAFGLAGPAVLSYMEADTPISAPHLTNPASPPTASENRSNIPRDRCTI